MVKKKAPSRGRHIPQRTCVACRKVEAKGTLVRLVRTLEGVQVDPKGKMPGRGAYLHANPQCWARGLGGSLQKALATELEAEEKARLQAFLAQVEAEGA